MMTKKSFVFLLLFSTTLPVFAHRHGVVDPPVTPQLATDKRLPVDEQIKGWYFCARHAIDDQWMKQQPKVSTNYHCTCTFFLKSDGNISDLKMLSSSGPAELDKSLLDAVKKTFPLQQKFESTVTELASNKTFEMDFDESDHPKYRFKVVN